MERPDRQPLYSAADAMVCALPVATLASFVAVRLAEKCAIFKWADVEWATCNGATLCFILLLASFLVASLL